MPAWPARRAEILSLFEQHVYGRAPTSGAAMTSEVTSVAEGVLGGLATRKEATLRLTGNSSHLDMHVLIYLPQVRNGAVPLFLGLNFAGNHTVHTDPGITVPTSWVPNYTHLGIEDHRARVESRGAASSRWAVETILQRGYGLATIYCGDIDPDFRRRVQERRPRALFRGMTVPVLIGVRLLVGPGDSAVHSTTSRRKMP